MKCNICGKKLEPNEHGRLRPTDMMITCIKHKEARGWVQVDIAKKWFEFKKDNPKVQYTIPACRKAFTLYLTNEAERKNNERRPGE